MSISKAEHDELCCVYSALLLFDDKAEITADKINKIITASGNKVDAYYPEFFAKYLATADLKSMLTVSAAPAGPAAAPEEAKADAKNDKKKGEDDKKKKKEEKKVEEEEEEGGFMDMFG